jgi:hypothetical protein
MSVLHSQSLSLQRVLSGMRPRLDTLLPFLSYVPSRTVEPVTWLGLLRITMLSRPLSPHLVRMELHSRLHASFCLR